MKKNLDKFLKWVSDVWHGRFEYPDSVYEFYEKSPFWNQIKYPLCSEHSYYANVVYLLWGDLECTCCAFHRGVIIGILLAAGVMYVF